MRPAEGLAAFGLPFRRFVMALALLAAAPAPAQVGQGELFVAAPGPVSMQLLHDGTSASAVNWSLSMLWRTGPGFNDYQFLGGAPGGCTAGGCTAPVPGPDSTRLGRNTAGPGASGWSNNAAGTTLTSPHLASGTVVGFFSRSTYGFRVEQGVNVADNAMMLTPGVPIQLTQQWTARPATIFPGPNNTARIGFNVFATAPQWTNFLDYPVRILVGNVCLR